MGLVGFDGQAFGQVDGAAVALAVVPDVDRKENIARYIVEGHETAQLTADELEKIGYSLAVYPLSALLSATRASQEVLTELRDKRTTRGSIDRMMTYPEFSRLVGLQHYTELDNEFGAG